MRDAARAIVLRTVDGPGKKSLTAVGQLLPSVLHTCVMKRLSLSRTHEPPRAYLSAYTRTYALINSSPNARRTYPTIRTIYCRRAVHTRLENALYRVCTCARSYSASRFAIFIYPARPLERAREAETLGSAPNSPRTSRAL